MINVSPIGRNCSQQERDEFEKHDLATGIRCVGCVGRWKVEGTVLGGAHWWGRGVGGVWVICLTPLHRAGPCSEALPGVGQ